MAIAGLIVLLAFPLWWRSVLPESSWVTTTDDHDEAAAEASREAT